jgi:hypothetical protein
LASLNGRPYQFLIDPTVDLSVIPCKPFTHATWIVPLQEGDRVGDYPASLRDRVQRMKAVIKAHRSAE